MSVDEFEFTEIDINNINNINDINDINDINKILKQDNLEEDSINAGFPGGFFCW